MKLTPAPEGYPIKLVRDQTPEILNGTGEPGDLWYGECPPGQRLRWLRLKLAEEVGEYLVDRGADELADVVAVVAALAEQHHLTLEQLLELAASDERGGFHDGVMMFGRHAEFDLSETNA